MAKTLANVQGSDIPVGTQFSAETVNLREFCAAAVALAGTPARFLTAIWKPPIRIAPVNKIPTGRRATLPIEAAVQYGLLDGVATSNPTALCKQIAASTESVGYQVFAKDILLNRNGLAFVSMLRTMLADDTVETITADTIARYSTLNCGLRIIEHNTAVNTLRMYLARAGVFPASARLGRASWTPDAEVVSAIVGEGIDALEGISQLLPHQLAFLRALCALDEEGKWLNAAKIREHAELLFPGVQFSRASIVNDVLEDLKALDLIEYKTGGTSGGKSATLRTTAKFNAEVLTPYLKQAVESVGRAAEKFLRTPAAEIKLKFKSTDKHEKGVGLEALAIRVMRTLGLTFNKWRVRSKDSGYAEVDVSLIGVISFLATKWQVQCKNTPSATIGNDEISREVGIALVEGATHILFLANCRYSKNARDFVRSVHRQTSMTVFLLDDRDLALVLEDFSALSGILRRKAVEIAEDRKR